MSLTAFRSASLGNSFVASLQMPILPQLDTAIAELTSLLNTMQQSSNVNLNITTVEQAYNALVPVDDALPQGELEEIGLNLKTDKVMMTALRITQHLKYLKDRAQDLRSGTATIYTENDVHMYRSIIGQPSALKTSFAARTSAAAFRTPDWAKTLTARWEVGAQHEYPILLGSGPAIVGSSKDKGATSEIKNAVDGLVSDKHFEIRFTPNGRYWIRDLGSKAGTWLNGAKLKPQKWYELEESAEIGFQDKDGKTYILKIEFRDRDRLEVLRKQIAYATSFQELIDLLSQDIATLSKDLQKQKANPQTSMEPCDEQEAFIRELRHKEICKKMQAAIPELRHQVKAVQEFVDKGVDVGKISESGGLARRVRQLDAELKCKTLEAPFEALHRRYSGTLPEKTFLPHYQMLTQAIEKATSYEDILTALLQSGVLRLSSVYTAVKDFAAGRLEAYATLPNDFGIRAKVLEIASAGLSANVKSDLEKIHLSLDDYFAQPWNQNRVSQALRLTLAGLRQDGKQQRDFRALMTLIANMDTASQDYVVLKKPTDGELLEHEEGDWRYVGNLYSQSPFTGCIDIVTSVAHEGAFWSYVSDKLAALVPTPFQMRIPKAGNQSTADVVAHLYFHPGDQQALYQLLGEMAADHPEFLQNRATPFTLPVKGSDGKEIPGIRLSQVSPVKPGAPDARFRAMKEATLLIDLLQKNGQSQNWNQIYQIFAYFFDRAGFNSSQPALLKDGEDQLSFLLHPPRAKKSRKTVQETSGVQTKRSISGKRRAQ